jgi:surfactin synthase thioesterase subunit
LYFNGFCLKDEQELFENYLLKNDFTVSGLSLGAIKAFEYTITQIKNNKRVDTLQLFSPAYFMNVNEKYKKLQLVSFEKDNHSYKNMFLTNISKPKKLDLGKYLTNGSYEELKLLLNYIWDKKDFIYLINNNVNIEVYLGQQDKIIDTKKAKDFFKAFCEVYVIKDCGHIL